MPSCWICSSHVQDVEKWVAVCRVVGMATRHLIQKTLAEEGLFLTCEEESFWLLIRTSICRLQDNNSLVWNGKLLCTSEDYHDPGLLDSFLCLASPCFLLLLLSMIHAAYGIAKALHVEAEADTKADTEAPEALVNRDLLQYGRNPASEFEQNSWVFYVVCSSKWSTPLVQDLFLERFLFPLFARLHRRTIFFSFLWQSDGMVPSKHSMSFAWWT